jgi:hypothetical protein
MSYCARAPFSHSAQTLANSQSQHFSSFAAGEEEEEVNDENDNGEANDEEEEQEEEEVTMRDIFSYVDTTDVDAVESPNACAAAAAADEDEEASPAPMSTRMALKTPLRKQVRW